MVTGYIFGYEAVYNEKDETWHWQNNGLEVNDNPRACPKCSKVPTRAGHDPCLGTIEGAVSACCGHGKQDGYIMWEFGDYPRDDLGIYIDRD